MADEDVKGLRSEIFVCLGDKQCRCDKCLETECLVAMSNCLEQLAIEDICPPLFGRIVQDLVLVSTKRDRGTL